MSAILTLVAGAMTLATSQPWLVAALGPTAVVVAQSPRQASSRFHSIVVGHLSALLCAWLIVILFILILVRRERRLDRELSRLKSLVGHRENLS